MIVSGLRILLNLLGVVLTAVSFLATMLACSVAAAMTYVWFTEPFLSPRDLALWRGAAVGLPVGALLSWASYRLANYGRPPRRRRRSLLANPVKRAREERWALAFGTLAAIAAVGFLVWNRTAGEPAARAWRGVGWAVGFFVILHARILWHELGHLLAGLLVGVQPLSLRVGSGPVVWQRVTARGFWWEWRLWPWWGYVQAVDRQARPVAWRFFLAVAGGPLVDVACLALLFYTLDRGGVLGALLPRRSLASGPDQLFGLLPIWMLVAPTLLSFLPSGGRHDGHVFFSDGWWLCRAFFLPREFYRERTYAVTFAHLQRLYEAGHDLQARAETEFLLARFPRRRMPLTLVESRRHLRRGERALAEACFQRAMEESVELEPLTRSLVFAEHAALLARQGDPETARVRCAAVLARVPAAERIIQLDAFACVPFYHQGTRALLPDAERWCAEAMGLSPDKVTLRGTRAAILFEQGRVEEAIPLLRDVLATAQSELDRGIASFYLALAAGQRGQRREMITLRNQALRWCKVPALLGRLHTEFHPV